MPVTVPNWNAISPFAAPPYSNTISSGTTALTLTSGDHNRTLTFLAASPVTVTVPSLTAGTVITLIQGGTGKIVLRNTSGCVINHPGSHDSSSGQYSVLRLNYDTDSSVVLSGDTALHLMAAGTENRVFSTTDTGASSRTRMVVRWPVVIGSGDYAGLVFSLSSLIMSATGATTGSAYTVEKMALENSAGSAYTPITFNGLRNIAVAADDNDIHSDILLPSAFSLSKFTRAERYWLRAEISVASDSTPAPVSVRDIRSYTGSSVGWFDPAVTTLTNGVDGVGAYTVSGTALNSRNTGWCPLVLGRPLSLNAVVPGCIGDSIYAGTGDDFTAGTHPNGRGIFQRTMTDADNVSNPRAGINLARQSTNSAHWTAVAATPLRDLLKYTNVLIEELGTNGIAGIALTDMQSAKQALWAEFRAKVPHGKILVPRLLTYTTSTDSWVTTVNQSIVANWEASGKAEQFNSWVEAQEGVGHDGFIDIAATLIDATTPQKWAVDGTTFYMTTDGLHPSFRGHRDQAVVVRTALAGVTLP